MQFTPDLLPADLIGTLIYQPQTGSFQVRKGPVFANLVLADEINRAPAKVQSALLEAMQEGQVTIGDDSFSLPQPFLVLATQNPLEQEGTYPLPEAQVDRFMLKLHIPYPNRDEELQILERMAHTQPHIEVKSVVTPADILQLREVVDSIYLDDKIKQYIVDIVYATREPKDTTWTSAITSITAPRRGRPFTWRWPPKRRRSCAGGDTLRPRTSSGSAWTCCAIASSSHTRRKPRK